MEKNIDIAHTPKELVAELKSLVSAAEAMMAESVTEPSSELIETIRARLDSVQERFAEVYDGAKKKIAAGAQFTDETIRANPYQSMAIAAGVGLLVGVLVGRRTK